MSVVKYGLRSGVAFGSGGAKGAALIGALKAFEQRGITFDVVAGTSIGSFVGAMYALGFSADEMTSVASEFSTGSSMVAAGFGGLKEVFDRIFGGAGFGDLKKPFRAIATDMVTGREVVFTRGDLAVAVAASCSIPPAFKPVKYRGKELIDGAFVNYVPADACVKMGAEAVVGINLGVGREYAVESKPVLDEMYPYNGVPLVNRSEKGYKYSSIMLEPDLAGYKSTSVTKIGEMYRAGYSEAEKRIDEVVSALEGNAKVFCRAEDDDAIYF